MKLCIYCPNVVGENDTTCRQCGEAQPTVTLGMSLTCSKEDAQFIQELGRRVAPAGQTKTDLLTEQSRRQLLINMVDTKHQKMVSLDRVAQELGVDPLTSKEINEIVESRK